MALIRIIDWSTRAPALPEKQPPLPGMPQKLLRLDGEIIRDSLTGFIGHCDGCGVPATQFDSDSCYCDDCLDFVDAELRAKHEEG